jgi:hypothetical protein
MSAILRTELSGPNAFVFTVETLPVLILFKMWLTTNDFIHTLHTTTEFKRRDRRLLMKINRLVYPLS